MSLEWNEVKLEDVGKIITGKTPKTSIEDNYGGHIPFLTPSDDMNVKIIKYTNKTLTLKGLNEVKNCLIPKNSVCVSCIGSDLGKVVLTSEDTVTNQQINSIIVNEKFDYNFIYYTMILLGKQLNYMSKSSTAVPIINKSTFSNELIFVPSLEEQKKISSILSNIDAKIDNLDKINKNLFNIIDFIFKDYVGDYEDLEIVSLSENTQEIIRGFNSKYVEKSNIKNFNQKVNKGTFLEKQHFKYLDENIEIPKAKFAKKRDVLVNSLGDGTVGRPHYYNEDTDNVVVDQHITIIRANEDLIPSTYIYEYLKNSTGQYHLDSLISGSTGMLMLNISEIRNLKIPILDKKNLREFDTTVTPLFDKITKNFEEIYCLSKLRDTLLPKLMSGEIDVSKINCDLKIIIRKIYIKSSKLFLWRYLSENQNYIKNTKSNETLLKSRTIHKINKFLAKFNARYRYYRQ